MPEAGFACLARFHVRLLALSGGQRFPIGITAWTGGIDSASPFRSAAISQIARAPQSENIVSPKRRTPEARISGRIGETPAPFGAVRDARRRSRGRYGPSSTLHRAWRPISWSGALLRGALSMVLLQSRAFQRVCRSTTHKCTAFRPESGHGSGTVRKHATRCTRKWGRIPRTGKNS